MTADCCNHTNRALPTAHGPLPCRAALRNTGVQTARPKGVCVYVCSRASRLQARVQRHKTNCHSNGKCSMSAVRGHVHAHVLCASHPPNSCACATTLTGTPTAAELSTHPRPQLLVDTLRTRCTLRSAPTHSTIFHTPRAHATNQRRRHTDGFAAV